MNLPKNIALLMDLKPEELSILHFLEHDTPVLASMLSSKTHIPRATLDRLLKHLHKRKLVEKRKCSKRRSGWCARRREYIEHIFGIRFVDFNVGNELVRVGSNKHEVRIHKGRVQMLLATRTFIQQHAQSRIAVIQTNKTWNIWSDLEQSVFSEINQLLLKNKVIVESILPSNIVEQDIRIRAGALLKGYAGRLSVTHAIPQEYLNFTSDISIGNNAVYLMNWSDEIGIEIRNPDIRNMFQSLFRYCSDSGDRLRIIPMQ